MLPGVPAPVQMGLDGLAYAPESTGGPESEPDSESGWGHERQLWLRGVELGTLPFRIERAGRHRQRAAGAREQARDATQQQAEVERDPDLTAEERASVAAELGELVRKAQSTAQWHEVRAEGVMARFESIRTCGSESMVRRCQGCGHEHSSTELGCGDWKLCLKCRSKRIRKYRARWRRARRRACERYRFATRGGRRWSEKMVTLTVAHSGDVVADVAELRRALPRFLRLVKLHLVLDRGVPEGMVDEMPWFSVLECTCGDDYAGHAHVHLWLLSPYLPHELLRLYWWRALSASYQAAVPVQPRGAVLGRIDDPRRRSELSAWLKTRRGRHGRPLAEVPWPVVDVRAGRNCEKELIKYLVKDGDRKTGELRLMEPALYARIYIAYCGRRSIQACRRFWAREAPAVLHCARCGCCDLRAEVVATADQGEGADGRDRGPPELELGRG